MEEPWLCGERGGGYPPSINGDMGGVNGRNLSLEIYLLVVKCMW